MITGDHPRTAARIAGDLGIVSGDARVLAGDEIEELDDEALGAAVGEVSVYARVAPEHKLRIVDALQAGGNIVAMTGDGVNDAPALKSADIGVAMRSEEHTSALQSLMRISYAVFCLKKKKIT